MSFKDCKLQIRDCRLSVIRHWSLNQITRPATLSLLKGLLCCILVSLFLFETASAQITSGKITYERKTNLYKKFKSNDVKDWLKEEDKNKIDIFELYFNDTASVFKPQETDLKEKMSWATNQNTVYQNFNSNKRLSIKEIWGEQLHVQDSLWKRQWKITESKRNISGYNCRKAIWQANDSTRIYAWYADDIIPSTGPESFNGLPGAILGLATEDGSVVYFAKIIEPVKPAAETIAPKKTKSKIYTAAELRARLEKDFGKEKWGRMMINEVLGLW